MNSLHKSLHVVPLLTLFFICLTIKIRQALVFDVQIK